MLNIQKLKSWGRVGNREVSVGGIIQTEGFEGAQSATLLAAKENSLTTER